MIHDFTFAVRHLLKAPGAPRNQTSAQHNQTNLRPASTLGNRADLGVSCSSADAVAQEQIDESEDFLR